MTGHETNLERAIESLVYTIPDPTGRVLWGLRLGAILTAVVDERARQEEIGREKRRAGIDWRSCADPAMVGGDGTRFLVLGEEVGEVANAILEAGYTQDEAGDAHLREELVQVVAVGLAWLEAIEARSGR